MRTASDELTLELQLGRVLHGRPLALAVALRNLVWVYLQPSTDLLAPAWVVVRERTDGSRVLRVSAGREAGAGEHVLRAMQDDAAVLDRAAFVARWSERHQSGGRSDHS